MMKWNWNLNICSGFMILEDCDRKTTANAAFLVILVPTEKRSGNELQIQMSNVTAN